MVPEGSITSRSELGVNIRKIIGSAKKNGQEMIRNGQQPSTVRIPEWVVTAFVATTQTRRG